MDIRNFYARFGTKEIHIAGGSYPKGTFVIEVMNLDDSFIEEITEISKPIIEVYNKIQNGWFDMDTIRSMVPNIVDLTEMIIQIKPFSLMNKADAFKSAEWFGDDQLYKRMKYAQKHFDDVDTGLYYTSWYQYKQMISNDITFYALFANDLCVCRSFFTNFYDCSLSVLDRYQKTDLLKAWHEFGSGDWGTMQGSSGLEIKYDFTKSNFRGFWPEIATYIDYDVKETAEGKFDIVRTYTFDRLTSFLTADFFEGLNAGHYSRKCGMCGRYFLMENSRNQKYCNGYFPGDERNRTCRALAARLHDKERELAQDHPIIITYKRCCDAINHQLQRGKISEKKATVVKRLAHDKKYRALRDNDYFLNEYEKEMTQNAIYDEANLILGEKE